MFSYNRKYNGWVDRSRDIGDIGKIKGALEREGKVDGSYSIIRVLRGAHVDLIHYFNGDNNILQINLDNRLTEHSDSDLEKLAKMWGLNLGDLLCCRSLLVETVQ